VAVATAVTNSASANKTVEEYCKDLVYIKVNETIPIPSADYVFIPVISFIAISFPQC
jgi:hypothetical protein